MSDASRRVLVVEDEVLIAMLIEDMLVDLGHEVAGTAHHYDAAVALARGEGFDIALLDLRVDGTTTYAVADILIARGIPFAFVTGRDKRDIAPAYAGVPVLQKPFHAEDLAAIVVRLAGTGTPGFKG